MMKTTTPKDPEEGQQGLEPEPQPAFDLKIHPLAELLPKADDYTFEALCSSIQADGLLHPLWIYEGELLDGETRKRACEKVGHKLKASDFKTFTGTTEEALAHVLKLNITTRRQVTKTQRIAIASELANLGHGGPRTNLQSLGLGHITMEQAAKMRDVSTSGISAFRAIKDRGLIQRMRVGNITVWEAQREVAEAEREQAEANLKEARQLLREKKKAAPGPTSNNGGGGKDKAKPGKKSTWDPNTSKATRAYAIKTLKEQGFPTDDEALVERTIEEYKKYETDQAELHKEETNGEDDGGAAGSEDGDGEVESHPVRRKHDYTATYVGGTGTYVARQKLEEHDEGEEEEDLDETRLTEILKRLEEMKLGAGEWSDREYVQEVVNLLQDVAAINGWE